MNQLQPTVVRDRATSSWYCSSSGRVPGGSYVASKKSFADAHRYLEALHRPLSHVLPTAAQQSIETKPEANPSRRLLLQSGSVAAMLALFSSPSQAVSMPRAFDNAWSAIGGGPADLTFPEDFLGRWVAESTLVKVETPLGPDFVPNPQVVERARQEDLKRKIQYEVSYIRNRKGKVIIDRRFNTSSLMNLYMGRGSVQEQSVKWNPDDPNRLALQLPGGMNIVTRVTRRSEEAGGSDRISTSEFFEQVFQSPGRVEPRVKASQCFTKYKWRTQAAAASTGGPQIVATQVVSDYLTPYDGETTMLRAKNRPVVVYTYNMTFRRTHSSFDA